MSPRSMKVVHVPYSFHPDPMGGTEVYVHALARSLRPLGVESLICAPGERDESYVHDGLRVRRVAAGTQPVEIADLYGEGDARAAGSFGALLDEERPRVVHLHSITPRLHVRAVREATARGLPVVLTYHTASMTCRRGTLMRWGSTRCTGELSDARCAACALHSRGIPRPVSGVLAAVPDAVGRYLEARHLQGGPWTALRMGRLVSRQNEVTRALLREVDAIVAPARWVEDLLRLNGVPESKIVASTQGVPCAAAKAPSVPAAGDLRVVALGRLDPAKGFHILVDALRRNPDLRSTLDIFGLTDPGSAQFAQRLRRAIGTDRRIRLLPAVLPEEVVPTLRGYDLLAVPSQGLETGPLVVLEAFSAGVPVIASRVDALTERVHDGIDGLLVERADVAAWGSALRTLSSDRTALARLRAGITAPPAMDSVASAMKSLYSRLCESHG